MPEFRIQRCLGRGGFGEVYKGLMARKGGVEVDVAIKVLRPDLDPSSQGVQRLRDEGRLLGRLTHPTILRVYDLVVIEERAALVTEYIPGQDLGALMGGDDGIPPRAVFEVIAQVAAALDAAWSWPSVTDGKPLHLVHRDIKPDNIRIDPHGVVKLLDFGIAQAQTVKREAHTSVNTIMGSTQYLAPERMVQQEVGPEADVFALGCTLYEALTGDALFIRKSMRQMYMLMVDERKFEKFVADRCDALREVLPSDRAVALIRAMTAYRKSDRPSASEVAARCDAIGDSLKGPTLGQWCRGRDWPPPPEMAGPLDGMRFTSAQPLVDPKAETLALKAPDSLARTQPNPTPAPPPTTKRIGSEDPTLEPGDLRAPVLGEADGPQTSDEARRHRDSVEQGEGPLPWSTAEMVALFSEGEEGGEARVEPDADTQIRDASGALPSETPTEGHVLPPELDTDPPTSEGETEAFEIPVAKRLDDLDGVPTDAPSTVAKQLAPARVEGDDALRPPEQVTSETTVEVPERIETTQPAPPAASGDDTVELHPEAREETVSGLAGHDELPVAVETDPGGSVTEPVDVAPDVLDVQTDKLDPEQVQQVVRELSRVGGEAAAEPSEPLEEPDAVGPPPEVEAEAPQPDEEPEAPQSPPQEVSAEQVTEIDAPVTPDPDGADTEVAAAEAPVPQGAQEPAPAPTPDPDGADTEVAAPVPSIEPEHTHDDDTDLGPELELARDGDTQESPEETAESLTGPPSVPGPDDPSEAPAVEAAEPAPAAGEPASRRRKRSRQVQVSPVLALFSGVAGLGAGLAVFSVLALVLWLVLG